MDRLDPATTRVLVVGLGLMGGSYARALTEQGFSVAAVDRDATAIGYALERGWIARGTTNPKKADLAEASLVVFALYPHAFVDWVREHCNDFRDGALLTDVTGVKGGVVDEVQALLPAGVEFVAAHPMAGREHSGIAYADAAIFRGANYIVTPTPRNSPTAVELCKSLGERLGFARISVLTPAEHDEMIAFLSQLTHCIAVSLMACKDAPDLVRYTGDSFRDLTRIADINDAMWSELFLMNRETLLRQMDLFAGTFAKLRDAVAAGDAEAIRALMRLSSARRRQFGP